MITGCSSGIGRAMALEVLRRGDHVVATARRPETISDLEEARCLVERLDVTDAESIENAVSAAMDWAGRIDVLVNNAGYGLIAPLAEVPLDDLRRQLDTNVVGAVSTIQAVVPQMAIQGSGCIVNIGSVSAVLATPYGGAYSASKAALHMLSDALRMELAPFGIDVVVVRAGGLATNFATAASDGTERFRDPSSLYHSVADGIEERARMSENLAMPADVFARRVMGKVCGPSPPAVIKIGGGSRLVPALALLPKKLLAKVLGRKFGLSRRGG
jgi:NAD(P)-dependent dehydrogenase (short-subunit alcohol dehydrogenase family)